MKNAEHHPRYRRRFGIGKQLTLIGLIVAVKGGQWTMLRGRPRHPRIVENMSLRYLDDACRKGDFCEAIDFNREGEVIDAEWDEHEDEVAKGE